MTSPRQHTCATCMNRRKMKRKPVCFETGKPIKSADQPACEHHVSTMDYPGSRAGRNYD